MGILSNLFGKSAGVEKRAAPTTGGSPYSSVGSSGVEHYDGMLVVKELEPSIRGSRRHKTYQDMVYNSSIVSTGSRFTLDMIAKAKWFFDPADETPAAQEIADLFSKIFFEDLKLTPWKRVVRNAALYKLHGFSVSEWTATKRDDGRVGLLEVERRPQNTIERWQFDKKTGELLEGAWQTRPRHDGDDIFVPRSKMLYLVDDMFTNSPEGTGLFRNLIKAYRRLEMYETLESVGFETDLRGIPVIRAPISLIDAQVEEGSMTLAQKAVLLKPYTDFMDKHYRNEKSGVILDSTPWSGMSQSEGETLSSTQHWGLELLQHSSESQRDIHAAIERMNYELAVVLNVEQLMIGSKSGSRALSEDKTDTSLLLIDSALSDIAAQAGVDLVDPLMALNGIDERLRPCLKHEELKERDVSKMAATLRDMAAAGAPLELNDPVINDMRDAMGVSNALEASLEADVDSIVGGGKRPKPKSKTEPSDDKGKPPKSKKDGKDDIPEVDSEDGK